MKTVFQVTGMACKHCAAKVTAKATSLAGVEKAEVVLEAGTLTVEYNEKTMNAAAIAAEVTKAGFPTKEA